MLVRIANREDPDQTPSGSGSALFVYKHFWQATSVPNFRNLPYSGERSGSVIRVLDLRSRGCVFKPHQRHCVVSLGKILYP